MKKITIKPFINFLAVFSLILSFGIASSNGKSMAGADDPKDVSDYQVPAEKAQLWEDIKKVALNDYDVCQEHCAYEQECLDRCEQAYNTRLEREYEMLLQK